MEKVIEKLNNGVNFINSQLPSASTVNQSFNKVINASFKNLPKLEDIKIPNINMPMLNYIKYNKEIYSDKYIYYFDLPGVKMENIKIEDGNDNMIVRIERKDEECELKPIYRYTECSIGVFERTIPKEKDALYDQTKMELKDGVLKLDIPKKC